MKALFNPARVGGYTLPIRLIMAPMIRLRTQFDAAPGTPAAEYSAQRASPGLIVAGSPRLRTTGSATAPGIHPVHHTLIAIEAIA